MAAAGAGMTRCVHCGTVANRKIPGLRIDLGGNDITIDGTVTRARRQHLEVMAALIDAYPSMVTRPAFESVVPSIRKNPDQAASLDVVICYLRKRLAGTRYSIELEFREGYRLVNGATES